MCLRLMRTVILCVSLVMILSSVELATGGDDPGMALYREVLAVGSRCAAGKARPEAILCFVKASPKKCESKVYAAFLQQNDAQSLAQRAWASCVASCFNADYWSRNFGGCARELQ